MLGKKELFEELSKDFEKAVREYRKAKEQSECTSGRLDAEVNEDYMNLTRKEYREQILKAKIEVIACIGGFKMMQEFCGYLYERQEEEWINTYSAFDYFADGIGGWIR